MTALSERLRVRYFGREHPYRALESLLAASLPANAVLLDAGCGRTAPLLEKQVGKAQRLIGVDIGDIFPSVPGIEVITADLGNIPLEDASVDLAVSRSVMEHLAAPETVYAEVHRLLRPGGQFIFLTPNLWDYASLISLAVPDSLHPYIVSRTEGRSEADVFPTYYRSNSRRKVHRLARGAGFEVGSFQYLGQYPNYFMFNGALFLAATAYEKLISKVRTLNILQGWILVSLRKPRMK